MLADPPAPAKRAFDFPLPAEALDYFVHPGAEPPFARAFTHGDHVFAGNGYAAIRVSSFIDPDTLAPAPAAADRFLALPWDRFDQLEDPAKWKPLDSIGGILWKYGPKPIWERTRTRFHIRTAPAVTIGRHAVALFPLIQLCARLPRAAVWIDNSAKDPVLIRFNGGEVILPYFQQLQPPRFHLLRPRTHFDGKIDW